MKKQLLIVLALATIVSELSAGLLDNTLETAGNLTDNALNVPGDVIHGPNRTNRRNGLFSRRTPADRSYSRGFDDSSNPEL